MKLFGSHQKTSNHNILCQNLLIGGAAGEGIKSAGKIAALCLVSSGYNVLIYDEYPSLIRGGHNSISITFSPNEVYSTYKEIDILVCLNRETFDKHKENLNINSLVIYDKDEFKISEDDLKDYPCEVIDIPCQKILAKNKLPKICENIVKISSALTTIGITQNTINKIIRRQLGHKALVINANLIAAKEGFEAAEDYFKIKSQIETPENESDPPDKKNAKYLLAGSDALAIGAVKSGIQFYAAYPMTPSTGFLHFFAKYSKEYNIVVKQTEDEIAAINMAIGASFAGARSMVATSGGGFSLMTEGLGLAAITETPLVVILAQRPGPATGLPTRTSQSDLLFALHASQDEFPRVILTPTDIEECYYLGFEAFNLAEKYQTQVIILIDKYLSESLFMFSKNSERKFKINRGLLLTERHLARIENFNRYEITASGISPRSIPGQANGIFLANSDESDEKGYSQDDTFTRVNKVNKRFRKFKNIHKDLPDLNIYGDIRSKNCFICWGSTKGAVLEAMRRLVAHDISFKLLALNYVEPFPTEIVNKFMENSKNIFIAENNYSSQLNKLINIHTGMDIENKILKYDGIPIFPDDIVDYVISRIKK